MLTSPKELVYQAIRFGSPKRVPVVFWNQDQVQGDVILYHLALGAPGDGTPNSWNWSTNEWGYVEEYSVMGMSAENFRACGDAFRCLRPWPP